MDTNSLIYELYKIKRSLLYCLTFFTYLDKTIGYGMVNAY